MNLIYCNSRDDFYTFRNSNIENKGNFGITGPCRMKNCAFLNARTRTFISAYKQKKKSLSLATFTIWLGWLDSNQRNGGIRIRCLTTWRHPKKARTEHTLRPALNFFNLRRFLGKTSKLLVKLG